MVEDVDALEKGQKAISVDRYNILLESYNEEQERLIELNSILEAAKKENEVLKTQVSKILLIKASHEFLNDPLLYCEYKYL